MIGSNAEEMLIEGSLAVNGTVTEGGYSREELPEYFSGEIKNISDDTFRRLYEEIGWKLERGDPHE